MAEASRESRMKPVLYSWRAVGILEPGLPTLDAIASRGNTRTRRRDFQDVRRNAQPAKRHLVRLAAESTRCGMPIMRHLMLEFPRDSACLDIDDEYLLGPAFLVAPICTPEDRRKVYFPAGQWADIRSGKATGPTWESIDAPPTIIPALQALRLCHSHRCSVNSSTIKTTAS